MNQPKRTKFSNNQQQENSYHHNSYNNFHLDDIAPSNYYPRFYPQQINHSVFSPPLPNCPPPDFINPPLPPTTTNETVSGNSNFNKGPSSSSSSFGSNKNIKKNVEPEKKDEKLLGVIVNKKKKGKPM